MKKALKRYFKIVLVCFGIIILSLFLLKSIINSNNDILFKKEYSNNSWSNENKDFYIYKDGTIKKYNNGITKKQAKISKDELKKLKDLAKTISNETEVINTNSGSLLDAMSASAADAGVIKYSIYSDKLSSFILLNESGNTPVINKSENTYDIINFADSLFNKYLNDIFQWGDDKW